MGLATGIAVSAFSRLPFNKLSTSDSKKERVTISIIGFAHTHPVGHWARSNPSDEDWKMRQVANFRGIDIFPIIWFDDKSDDREINYTWAEQYKGY